MRHRRKTQNLSRFRSYFKATVHSLARAVLLHHRIITTRVRAGLAKELVDHLITLGKDKDSLASRRRAFSILNDHALVKTLFSEIAPRFSQKNGGYTRIIPYRRRRGDHAEMVVLELSVQVTVARPLKEKKVPKKTEEERPKALSQEEKKTEAGPEHKEVAPPQKEKHKKEAKKPAKKILGGFGKFFKSERDSL